MTGSSEPPPSLQAFLDAFNAHDIDAIMSFFTDDCVFDTPPRDSGSSASKRLAGGSRRGSTGFPTSTTATTATSPAATAVYPNGRSAAPK